MKDNQINVLQVRNLKVVFQSRKIQTIAVNGIDFEVKKGKVLGIVGESGSGKSVTALSIMRLIESPGMIKQGSIIFQGENLLEKNEFEMQQLRGDRISMIFQEPMTSLDPVFTVGEQIVEAVLSHQKIDSRVAKKRALEMLELVRIPNAKDVFYNYPHTLSGGMRQRIMIAIALINRPDLLIADEPTTALDVTTQSKIIDLMVDLQNNLNTSILFITHDLAIMAEIADYIAVMYAGEIVEYCSIREIFNEPLHPYTLALLEAIPRIDLSNQKLYVHRENIESKSPKGCIFYPRCRRRKHKCQQLKPIFQSVSNSHRVKCWFPGK